MKKTHLAIPLLFILVTALVVAYHVSVLVEAQESHAIEMLKNQAEISGRKIQDSATRFENDLHSAVTTIDFATLLAMETVPYDLLIQIRRFYAKYQRAIVSVDVRNNQHQRTLRNESENYFSLSSIKPSSGPGHTTEAITMGAEPGTVRYLQQTSRRVGGAVEVEVTVRPAALVEDELRDMQVSSLFWPWCIDIDGRIVTSLSGEGFAGTSGPEPEDIGPIVADIRQNYRGSLVHRFASPPGGTTLVYVLVQRELDTVVVLDKPHCRSMVAVSGACSIPLPRASVKRPSGITRSPCSLGPRGALIPGSA